MKVTLENQDTWDSFWSRLVAPSYALAWIGGYLWLCYPGEDGDLWGIRPPEEGDEDAEVRYIARMERHTVVAPHHFPVTVVWHDGAAS